MHLVYERRVDYAHIAHDELRRGIVGEARRLPLLYATMAFITSASISHSASSRHARRTR